MTFDAHDEELDSYSKERTELPGLVSVIIPAHGRLSLLREAVSSALDQSYRPLEIILVDDGSSADAVRDYFAIAKSNREVRVVRRPRGGPGAARETGRLRASGEFIQYLDSDDLLLPGKLEEQIRLFENDPSLDAVWCWARHSDSAGELIQCHWKPDVTRMKLQSMFPAYLLDRLWETGAALFRRELLDRVGPWSALSVEEDWEYEARVAALNPTIALVEKYLLEVRHHSDSRVSGTSGTASERLYQRSVAREMIHRHAIRAELDQRTGEFDHFRAALFALARECGAAGLESRSRRLLELAGGDCPGPRLELYRQFSELFSWTATGRISRKADQLRHRLRDVR